MLRKGVYPDLLESGGKLVVSGMNTTGIAIQSLDGRIILSESIVKEGNFMVIELPEMSSGLYLISHISSKGINGFARFVVEN